MSAIPKPESGSRFSGSEVLELVREAARDGRAGLPPDNLEELRAHVARRRARRHLDDDDGSAWLTMTQTAFILCRSKAYVRGLIKEGRLSGDFVQKEDAASGYAHWRIPALEVRNLACRRPGVCDLC